MIGLAIMLGACVPVTSTSRRDNTFTPFRERKVGDISLQDHAAIRTAYVLVGSEITDTEQSTEPLGQGLSFSYSAQFRFGTAAMVDTRGYLLTAAHVVDETPVSVIYYDGGRLRHQQARLVWNGNTAPGKPDLALLRVPLPLPVAYQWAEHYSTGDAVAAVGVNYTDPEKPNFVMGFSGGKLGKDRPLQRTPTTQTVTSDLPLHFGDSGGPLFDLQGKLIAINVRVTLSRLEYLGIHRKMRCDAIRPDLRWLQRMIEMDYSGNLTDATDPNF